MGKPGANTLAALENDCWGEPEWPSYLVTTLHRLRKKPLDQFTTEDLRINIGQGVSLDILIPMAVEILETDPFADGDNYRGDLLNAVCKNKSWLIETPALMERVTTVTKSVLKMGCVDKQFECEGENLEVRKAIEAFMVEALGQSKG